MSVTASVPSNLTAEAFSSIFTLKKQSRSRSSDVIYTLTSTVHTLENAVQQQQQQDAAQPASQAQADNDLVEAITQASVSNADPSQTTHLDGPPPQNVEISISIDEFVKQCRPFNPPPAPVPINSNTVQEASLQYPPDEEDNSQPTQQTYSTVLTIHESTSPNGQKTYSAHSTPLQRVEEADEEWQTVEEFEAPSHPTSGRTRIIKRSQPRLRRGGQRTREMFLISVKRQRRLKMKKHKYKKLMRRTRTLRRRLEKN